MELDTSTTLSIVSVFLCHIWWWVALSIMRVAYFSYQDNSYPEPWIKFSEAVLTEGDVSLIPDVSPRIIPADAHANPGTALSTGYPSSVKYDNSNPTESKKALTGWGARALNTMNNHAEQFGFFAAAVALSIATRGPNNGSWIVSGLGLGYALCRLAHLLCYVYDLASLRSIVFFIGALAVIATYIVVLIGE